MTDTPSVLAALLAVMGEVQAIRKSEHNRAQNFSFRGIDTVVNAVGPAFRSHGVVCVPDAESVQFHDYETSKGTTMRNAVVKVRFVFYGPAGDSIECCTFGEASDAGDKAVSKAHSVAYRTALLQALTIPTDEPDPDQDSHQRAAPATAPAVTLSAPQKALQVRGELLTAPQRAEIRAVWQGRGLPGRAADMSDDEAHMALDIIKEKFPV